jgi:hypothetical protein
MERELWHVLTAHIDAVDLSFVDDRSFYHRTAQVARVYLWAALHNQSMLWATRPAKWPAGSRQRKPGMLPDQSTLSRRTRGAQGKCFERFLDALGLSLSKLPNPQMLDLKRIDGKPLLVARHSKDKNATFGRGAGGMDRGYKLHVLWGSSILPEAFAITPLNVDERKMARRLVKHLAGQGYVVADGNYDANDLYHQAMLYGYQLMVPRDTPGSGLGNRKQRPGRLRNIELMERNIFGLGSFGPAIYKQRRSVEQCFGNLTCGTGALAMSLPYFVRRIWRVRNWVRLKLLIYAARCLVNTKQAPIAA